MPIRLGTYNLCAPGQPIFARSMYLPPSAAWIRYAQRLDHCCDLAGKLDLKLSFAVLKYPWGQSCIDDIARPRFLDILSLRDLCSRPGLISASFSNLAIHELTRFERLARLLEVSELFYYCGQPPTIDEQADLSDRDWADLVFVINSSEARFVLDSACYPPLHDDTLAFLRTLEAHGARRVWERFCGEAFPEGISTWPNLPGCACFGEDLAWHNRTTASFRCDSVLLYTGNNPVSHGLPPETYTTQAAAALRAGYRVALPIDAMTRAQILECIPAEQTDAS